MIQEMYEPGVFLVLMPKLSDESRVASCCKPRRPLQSLQRGAESDIVEPLVHNRKAEEDEKRGEVKLFCDGCNDHARGGDNRVKEIEC